MHALISYYSNYYFDLCLDKYLVSLVILYTLNSQCFLEVYLTLNHKDWPIFSLLKCLT